ncbi:MAG: molecular chaperone DnaJ [Synechococcaceae cyanobacterium]|nr:molecular chaperone DnaJ [Synechococcaceae cyanobacterium]
MPRTLVNSRPASTTPKPGLVSTGGDAAGAAAAERQAPGQPGTEARGFGGGAGKSQKRKGGRKRSPALSKGDWGPLGKHPDIEAIVARQRLHLPLSGRLKAAQVNQAWKRCAAEHHPDRGGEHDTMQLVNGARDLLLGRDLS